MYFKGGWFAGNIDDEWLLAGARTVRKIDNDEPQQAEEKEYHRGLG